MSWAKIAVLIAAMALGGFLFRYGSLDPCEWLRHDMTAKTGLPRIMVDAAVQVKLKGEMTAGNCFGEWLRFRHGDAEDLAAKVEWAIAHPEALAQMRRAARAEFEQKYTAERNYMLLADIYQRPIEVSQSGISS